MRNYYSGWNIVAASFLIHAIAVGVVIYGFSTLMLPASEYFGMNRMQMQACYSVMILLSGLVSPLGAVLMEKYSFRILFVIGGALFTAGFFLVATAVSYWVIFGTFAIVFSVMELLLGPMITGALLSRWFDRRRGLAIGISTIGFSFGGAVAPPAIAWLIGMLGWKPTFMMIGVFSFLAIAAISVFLVRDRPDASEMSRELPRGADPRVLPIAQPGEPESYTSYKTLARSGKLWIFAVIFGGATCAHSAIMLNFVPYATDVGLSLQGAAYLAAIAATFGVSAKILIGIVVDKLSYRIGLMISLVLTIVAAIMLNLLGSAHYVLLIAAALLGLGLGGMVPVWGVMVSHEFGPSSFARVMGLMRLVAIPLGMLGPVTAGWMYDTFGNYRLAFWGVAALDMLLIVLLLVTIAIFPFGDRIRPIPGR